MNERATGCLKQLASGRMLAASTLLWGLMAILAGPACSQALLWSEEFDGTTLDADTWVRETGNSGSGNGELQNYTADTRNSRVENGNLIITAYRESSGGRQFSSGRINTLGRLAFKYGDIEARIKVPDLREGLWPAFWTLGDNYGQVGWPACGEIDILEMGFESSRNAGVTNRRASAAAHWDYQGNRADYGGHIDAAVDLSQDFHLFRVNWTPTLIQAYLDGVPYWAIDISNPAGSSLEEFHAPHFIILNLAVGGYPVGITNPAQITAPFPAEMLVDWIRIRDNGFTEVLEGGSPPQSGNFGVFTDNTPVTDAVTYGTNAELYLWNNMNSASTAPFEGDNAWSFNVNAGNWFGMGVFLTVTRNMQNYAAGNLHFHMKATTTATIRIGLASSAGGEKWISLVNGGNQYGLVRDGQWHEVVMPISIFTGVDLATMEQMFMVVGDAPASSFNVSFDNVYWSQNPPPDSSPGDAWVVR